MTAAVVRDMPDADYHLHPALSQSQAKDLLVSPAYYQWRKANRVESVQFDVGHAAHSLVLGIGAPPARAGFQDRRSKAWAAFETEAREAGKVPLTDPDWDLVHAMADRLSEHTLAMRLLSNGEPEVSVFATDDLTGVEMRGRLDWLGSRIATDYKTTRDLTPTGFGRAAVNYGYHIQAAWYLDLLAVVGEPRDAFAFIVQSKSPPFSVFVTELAPEDIDLGRRRYRAALERFRDCTEAGIWPDAVPDDAFLTTRLPGWAHRDEYMEEHSV